MHTYRLMILAAALRKPLPDGVDGFDMSRWEMKNHCGTVCCAMGLATRIPEFQALGLRMGFYAGEARLPTPQYGETMGFTAAAAFFGINERDASNLFEETCYPRRLERPVTPQDVADRIEELVARALRP